jgi:O-antigen/teichoic acid export membrane protein
MSENNSLLKNMFTFGISTATMGFLFLLIVIAARYLGPADFGIFTFALAFVFFFDFLLDPGLYHLLIREIARDKLKTGQYMLHAFAWKLIIIPVVFLLVVVAIHVTHESTRIYDAVYLMAISSFVKSIKDVYRSSLLANESFKLEAISSVIEKAGLLIVGGLILMMNYGLYGLCWTFVVVRIIDLIIIHIMAKQVIKPSHTEFHFNLFVDLIKTGVPIGAYYVTLNIYNYVDTVMISVMRNSTEVGWYSASYKVYEGLLIFPVIIGTVMLPRLSSCNRDDGNIFNKMVKQGWKYTLILALLVTAVGVPLSYEFIDIVYGDLYANSAIALQILLYGVAFAYMVNFLQTVIISIDQHKVLVSVAISGLILNIAFNYIAIQMYGYVGAAVVTVLVQALVFTLFGYYIIIKSAGTHFIVQLVKVISCWLLPAIPVMIISVDISSYVRALLWSLGFVVLLRITRAINDDEWRGFALVFQKIKSPVV